MSGDIRPRAALKLSLHPHNCWLLFHRCYGTPFAAQVPNSGAAGTYNNCFRTHNFSFFFCSAAVNRDQGHEFARNMLAEYTSSISILSEGWDCNTGTGGARHNVPEHDFIDASDFSKLTSGVFLEKEEALAATAVGHLNRESIRGIVEPRF